MIGGQVRPSTHPWTERETSMTITEAEAMKEEAVEAREPSEGTGGRIVEVEVARGSRGLASSLEIFYY
jgi:hypothetical protein